MAFLRCPLLLRKDVVFLVVIELPIMSALRKFIGDVVDPFSLGRFLAV